MQNVSVVQDNRESGVNPERSRRCKSVAIFHAGLIPVVTVKMGRRNTVLMPKSEYLPFYDVIGSAMDGCL